MGVLEVAAAAALTFNLNCAITVEFRNVQNPNKISSYDTEYRVNLKENKWCLGDCVEINEIVEIQPTKLTLKKVEKDGRWGKEDEVLEIDRETGEVYGQTASGKGIWSSWTYTKGKCAASPFTGFPAIKTQF